MLKLNEAEAEAEGRVRSREGAGNMKQHVVTERTSYIRLYKRAPQSSKVG